MKNKFLLAIPLGLAVLVIAVATMLLRPNPEPQAEVHYRATLIDPPVTLTDFSLPATVGTTFQLSEQQGKVILLYFGYTSCPDFCPTTLAQLTRVFKALGEQADQVQVVFVTGDLERDTPDIMTRYIAAFDQRFVGVIPPDQASLQAILSQFYAVSVRVETPDSAMGYVIEHTTSLFLIDPQGRWIGRYPYETNYEDIVHDVRLLLGTNS
jgi:protein SCO1/2